MRRWLPIAVALLVVAGFALAQRPRGGLSSVSGQAITPASITTSGPVSVTGNLTGLARICSDAACTTNYLVNDTFGTLNVVGSFSGSSNWSTAGDMSVDGYSNPKTGIRNTGTAAACSGNTGAVCINDTGGLAIANAGTTTATISSLGAAAFGSLTLSAVAVTPPFDWTLSGTSLALTGTPIIQEFGATASASTITASNWTPAIIGVGAGNFVAKLCSDTACAATTYVTCTAACTGVVGTVVACTINTAAVAATADPFLKVTTACATTNPQGAFVAHLTQP